MKHITFTDNEIHSLFGHEAAEDEELERLREYYFKNAVYEQVVADLPLRILVGHKGIGKSALFQIAMAEDEERLDLPILIKPDDILTLAKDEDDFLAMIKSWKDGLREIVGQKALVKFGIGDDELGGKLKRFGGGLIEFLEKTVRGVTANVDLQHSKNLVVGQFLKSRRINVYIDDLDRGWQGRRGDVVRISALLNAVRDVVNENKGIRFKIGLRSDVYYLVRTSDESTDKIEGSVVWHRWTNHEIFLLLVKRIETFLGSEIDESALLKMPQHGLARYLDLIFEERFQGKGKWSQTPMYRVLMSLIRKRPRDLVKLCTLAGKQAREDRSPKIRTGHFQAIFEEYSQGRVQDTINEFRSELPDIQRLITNIKPNRKERFTKSGYVYKTDELLNKIRAISEQGSFMFSNGKGATPKELAAFLYKINFLTARKETETKIIRKYFEENRYLSSGFADFGFDWEVHPAYRWALQPDDPQQIFQTLDVEVEYE